MGALSYSYSWTLHSRKLDPQAHDSTWALMDMHNRRYVILFVDTGYTWTLVGRKVIIGTREHGHAYHRYAGYLVCWHWRHLLLGMVFCCKALQPRDTAAMRKKFWENSYCTCSLCKLRRHCEQYGRHTWSARNIWVFEGGSWWYPNTTTLYKIVRLPIGGVAAIARCREMQLGMYIVPFLQIIQPIRAPREKER